MGIGTFGSFTQARLAIYAAQAGLQVTGNNISNINTEGYTRQRLDQESLYIGGADRYSSKYDMRIGQGVLCSGVSQLRDPYLDIRFRDETAKQGYMEERLKALNNLAAILDETGKGDKTEGEDFGLIAADIADLESALRTLSTETGHQEYDNQVRAAAESLCAKLNSYAARLQENYDGMVTQFEENVDEINDILLNIRDLNESIRNSEIHGQDALELRDSRNNLIDDLAKRIHIDVTYVPEDVGGGETVSKLIIKLAGDNPDTDVTSDSATLIDGIFGSQISIEQVPMSRPIDNDDPTSWPYEDKDGNPVKTKAEAAREKIENPDWDGNDPKQQYLDANGQPTDEAHAAETYKANTNGLLFVKPDGTFTNDESEARMVNNPNYNIKISELRDVRNNLLYYTDKSKEELVLAGDSDYADRTKGVVQVPENPKDGEEYTITVYRRVGRGDKAQYYRTVYTKTPSTETPLDDNDLYGTLQAQREMLTEAGEFTDRDVIEGANNNPNDPYRDADEKASTKRGIPYYQRSLDLLARQLATAMNEANKGFMMDSDGNYIKEGVDKDGKPAGVPITIMCDVTATGDFVMDPATDTADITAGQKEFALSSKADLDDPEVWASLPYDVRVALTNTGKSPASEALKEYVKQNGGIETGVNLFSNRGDTDDDTEITASNISVSDTWSKGPALVRSFTADQGKTEAASGDSENILHMMGLFQTKMDYFPNTLESTANARPDIMFNGTFREMWNDIGFTLGQDQKITGNLLDTHEENALQIDTMRDSVSAVDFNDEAMNLMMYAKSYNAACRLMTTIDSVLDKLVNGTGVTT